MKLINIFSYLFKSATLLKITEYYRLKNPGFSHHNYLLNPSNALLHSIHNNLPRFQEIERRYQKKHDLYIKHLDYDIRCKFYPWIDTKNLLTAYNAIYIPNRGLNKFLNHIRNEKLCVLVNPTYKIFNFPYPNRDQDKEFVENLLYLPSIANMQVEEMKYINDLLKSF